MKKTIIPLVKAAFKKQVIRAMLNNGLSPDIYLEKVGLPTHDQDDPESLIPVKPFYHLINEVAVDAGIPDFGAQVALITPWHKVESLAPLISNSSNLRNLLDTFCEVAPGQSYPAKFSIVEDEAGTWFSYIGTPLIQNDIQMELYRVTSMIQFVQLAAGSGWHPEKIQLLMPKTKIVEHCDLISKSNITFSQVRSEISISHILLKLPVSIKVPYTIQASNIYDMNAGFIDTLRNLIGIYISNRNCKIDMIAKVTEIPVRNLQRQLKHHGVSFSDLLTQAKLTLAENKLKNPSLSITDIAFQLGYSDSAHFSRAFHRWTGMSPSKFRKTSR